MHDKGHECQSVYVANKQFETIGSLFQSLHRFGVLEIKHSLSGFYDKYFYQLSHLNGYQTADFKIEYHTVIKSKDTDWIGTC